MAPTADKFSGAWGSRVLRLQTSQYVRCRPYCWSSPRFLMTTAALVRHIRFFRAAICVLLKDWWIWWLVLVTVDSVDDYPRESHLPSELPASVSKTAKWILLPFLYLSKVIYTRLELLLGCRYGSNKLGVPTKDYCFLISAILGLNGRLLPFASYRSMVTSRSIVTVVLATRYPRIAELHFLLPLPVWVWLVTCTPPPG